MKDFMKEQLWLAPGYFFNFGTGQWGVVRGTFKKNTLYLISKRKLKRIFKHVIPLVGMEILKGKGLLRF